MKIISNEDYEHAQQDWNTMKKTRSIAVSGCICNISEYVLKKLQIGSSTFLHRAGISMVGLIKDSRRVLRT